MALESSSASELELGHVLFMGNADEAIPILKRWIDTPSATGIAPALLRIDPVWDPIRNDPRFQELVASKSRN
jgi:hypothetical protein